MYNRYTENQNSTTRLVIQIQRSTSEGGDQPTSDYEDAQKILHHPGFGLRY